MAGAAALSALLRLRFLWVPLSSDEGGYLAIARAWRHGAVLYRDVWLDRPQGLLLLYRLFDMTLGEAALVRVLALLFGAVAVVAVALAVRAVASPSAGLAAAVFTAVLAGAPAIEGPAANGELLSGALSATAVALAALVLVGRRPSWWMVMAGLAGGVAWSMKQSGLDGLLAVGLWLAVLVVTQQLPWRDGAAAAVRLVAGSAVVAVPSAVHGVLTDGSGYWYAMVAYRAERRSVLEGADWGRLVSTARDAAPVLLPGAAVILLAAVLARRGAVRRPPPAGLLVVWLLLATAGFAVGGQFFHHYWVSIAVPLSALAGVAVTSVRSARVRRLSLVAILVPALWSWWSIAHLPSGDITWAVSDEGRPPVAEAVGRWLRHELRPDDTLYVLCAAAQVYAYAAADPRFRYLWFDGVHRARGGQAELDAWFTGPHPPTWVARFDSVATCDRSGVVGDVLAERYHQVAVVDGVRIMRLRP